MLALLGVIKKRKGALYLWWWMGGTNPDLTTCPINAPPLYALQTKLNSVNMKKGLFSRFCFLNLALNDMLSSSAECEFWLLADVLYALLAHISTVHLKLQDRVRNYVRVRRFEDLSRISVFLSERVQMCVCVCLCAVLLACLLFKCLLFAVFMDPSPGQ